MASLPDDYNPDLVWWGRFAEVYGQVAPILGKVGGIDKSGGPYGLEDFWRERGLFAQTLSRCRRLASPRSKELGQVKKDLEQTLESCNSLSKCLADLFADANSRRRFAQVVFWATFIEGINKKLVQRVGTLRQATPFETQDSRNSRLIQTAREQAESLILALVHPNEMHVLFRGLVAGGAEAALCAVQYCEYVKQAWGKGDEAKASGVLNVFTLHMLSKALAAGMPGDTLRTAKYVLDLCGASSETALTRYMDVHSQFQQLQEYATDTERILYYIPLLLARACEACGVECLDWDAFELPLEGLPLEGGEQIIDAQLGPFYFNGHDLTTMFAYLTESEGHMFKYFAEFSGQR